MAAAGAMKYALTLLVRVGCERIDQPTMMKAVALKKIKNWVYVTGVPRSGTTFVGQVLSFPLSVDYIHEPFNPACGTHGMRRRDFYMRPSLDTQEMQAYDAHIQRIFTYDFTLRTSHHKKDSTWRKLAKNIVGSRGPFYLRLAKLNPFHEAAVIKDPTASLLTEYLYSRFNVKPVVVIKHPVSLAASLKRLNWWSDLRKLKGQQHLVDDYFAEELDFLNQQWPSAIVSSAAHWRAVHKVLLAQASKYPDWQVVTIEKISANPVSEFKKLYEALDFPWSSQVEKKIRRMTGQSGSAEAREGRVQDLRRDSASIFELRRNSLTKEERKAIFDVVEDVALQLYPRESFAID